MSKWKRDWDQNGIGHREAVHKKGSEEPLVKVNKNEQIIVEVIPFFERIEQNFLWYMKVWSHHMNTAHLAYLFISHEKI